MTERPDLNFTFSDVENWTFPNGSRDHVVPRNNITYVGYYLHQSATAAVFIVSYLLIFVVCMVGNGVVCFIVLRSKNMRTVTNLFILNLAISDLLVGIFCMPTTLLDNIITGEWQFSAFWVSLLLNVNRWCVTLMYASQQMNIDLGNWTLELFSLFN